MTVAELARVLRDYFMALTAEGFRPAEAMQIAIAYQQTLLQNDLLERLNRKGDKPWDESG